MPLLHMSKGISLPYKNQCKLCPTACNSTNCRSDCRKNIMGTPALHNSHVQSFNHGSSSLHKLCANSKSTKQLPGDPIYYTFKLCLQGLKYMHCWQNAKEGTCKKDLEELTIQYGRGLLLSKRPIGSWVSAKQQRVASKSSCGTFCMMCEGSTLWTGTEKIQYPPW